MPDRVGPARKIGILVSRNEFGYPCAYAYARRPDAVRTFNLFSAKSIFCSVVFFFNLVKRDRASVFDELEFSSLKAGPAITASNSQKPCRRRSNCERSVLGGIEPSINASYVQRSIVYRSQLDKICLFIHFKVWFFFHVYCKKVEHLC